MNKHVEDLIRSQLRSVGRKLSLVGQASVLGLKGAVSPHLVQGSALAVVQEAKPQEAPGTESF